MTTQTRPQLTPSQQGSLDRAREALAQEHGYDPGAMAARIGCLGWHLEEMLALVGQLTGAAE